MANQHQNSFIDSLYCSENHLEEEDLEEQVVEQEKHDYINFSNTNNSPLVLLEQDLFWDNEELTSLLAKEKVNKLNSCLQSDTNLALARREAVEWMLKVNTHFSFSAQTAVLAVNYFDRFIFSFRFQINGKPWFTQLAAVTCLSLAAKMEEIYVPLPIDLQVVESTRYLFEGKTIKRMEILVLSTLEWKMNPVTPISFLDHITRRIGLKGYLCLEFLRRCETVLLSVFADFRFMSYLPSVLATAIMMLVVTSVEPCLGVEYQNQLLVIIGFNKVIGKFLGGRMLSCVQNDFASVRTVRSSLTIISLDLTVPAGAKSLCTQQSIWEKVEECYKLILEIVSSYDHDKGKESKFKKRKFGSFPNSPNGVMEGLFGCECDSSNECWELGAFVSYSPNQPLSKKNKTQDQLLLNLNH